MTIQKITPKLRFKDFTNDWEQHKLKKYIHIQKNKNKNNLPYEPFSISNIEGFISQNKQFGYGNTYSKTDKRNNYIVNPGSFAYNPARINVGSIAYQDLNKPVLVSSLYEVFTTNELLNDSFLMVWFRTDNFKKQIKELEEGGVRQYFFIDKMEKTRINLPTIKKEQDMIATLFLHLDKLISLQQRKLDQLQELKKGFLQNLFPVEGVLVPKLRFKGFTDNWEQKKLGDITKYKNGKTHEEEQKDSGKYQLVNLNSISLDGNLKNSGKYIDNCSDTLCKNDLVMMLSDIAYGKLVGRTAVIPQNNVYVLNQRVACLKVEKQIDPYFLSYYLNQHQPNFRRLAGGTSQLNLSKSSIEKFNVLIPSVSEQQKIATFLQINDDCIASQRRELERLKQFKKFLLQNMFI